MAKVGKNASALRPYVGSVAGGVVRSVHGTTRSRLDKKSVFSSEESRGRMTQARGSGAPPSQGAADESKADETSSISRQGQN